ncbi:prevent-host-death family protein [Aphanothece hegewaldii CCALA 016]|uniref:Prevent-host-death family protein n=1 Tax=Aphanothece hegewaldii CCALA 016 TaxID=2107694 RepID=A0A2T1LX27_9CHRO|nr:type II toxin-antitoxin system Phd/YefM family antitoxin [Aphanothece hegewaldii]PSF36736.1 prevent-host-death family protein [Aphanothece hegewaldii CCALA 016]
MKNVSEDLLQENLLSFLDSIQDEPIAIVQSDQKIAVILSIQEYERLINFNKADFQQFCDQVGQQAEAKGLTEEKLQEILNKL